METLISAAVLLAVLTRRRDNATELLSAANRGGNMQEVLHRQGVVEGLDDAIKQATALRDHQNKKR